MLPWLKRRPRHIPLTSVQEKFLEQTNQTLLECARELYNSDPAQAPAIGEAYWNKLGFGKCINVSDMPEEPWIPGALAIFSEDEIKLREDLIVLNPEALAACEFPILGVLTVVIRPQIDAIVVASKIKNTTYIRFEPLQNLHVFITPEQDAEALPGTRYIQFNEDYCYRILDPNTIQELVTKRP